MNSVTHPSGPVHVGMDVSKNAIVAGIVHAGEETPAVEKIAHDGTSVRRLIGRLGDPGALRVCYEAGPTGYELHWLLTQHGGGL